MGVNAGTAVYVGISVNVGANVGTVGVQVGGKVNGIDVAWGGGVAAGPHEASSVTGIMHNRLMNFNGFILPSNP